jgi:GDP-4-dehydro-6-deoxy-D-mannose reductase
MNSESRILITGAAGLAGYWLKEYLSDRGFARVYYTDISATGEKGWFTGSVCDPDFMERVVRETEPEYVFHLAGLLGNKDLKDLEKVNVGGTKTLFESLASCKLFRTKVLVTSSSAVYGDKGEVPVVETMSLDGRSNYALSKLGQEQAGFSCKKEYGIPVVVSRAFNNIAPGERDCMFISRIAVQIVKIERGEQDILEIGPLFAHRDYLDTRDLVEAYALIMEKGKAGEAYNVCSGEAILIEELFDILIANAKKKIQYKVIEYDQSGNIPYQSGNADKLFADVGWTKKRDVRKTVIEILDYWRNSLVS